MSYAARQEALTVKSVATGAPVTPLVEPISVSVAKVATVSAVKSLISQGEITPKVVSSPSTSVTPLPGILGEYQKGVISGIESINKTAGIDKQSVDNAILAMREAGLDPRAIVEASFSSITPAYWAVLSAGIMANILPALRDNISRDPALKMEIRSLLRTGLADISAESASASSLQSVAVGAVSGAALAASGNWLYSNVPKLGYIKSKMGSYYIKKVR